jgi:glycosyltransferase involved in cell wall biosynthesis
MMKDLSQFTIILPTRDESHNIRKFLRSVPKKIKLVVVDASRDDTAEIILEERPLYTSVIKEFCSVTEARKIGSEFAQTKWLVFTDADIEFAPDFFDKLITYSGYDLIYGPKLSYGDYSAYYKLFSHGQYLIDSLGVPAASGSNCIITKEAYLKSGGFDIELTCNEDSELAWRVKQSGYKALYDPKLIVYATDHRRLEMGIIRKTLHSIIRCSLLYFRLMPQKWRKYDWGYWSGKLKDPVTEDGN